MQFGELEKEIELIINQLKPNKKHINQMARGESAANIHLIIKQEQHYC